VNRSPAFSADLPRALLETIEAGFPDQASFGKFDVYMGLPDDDD
jgi:hypothetical protein